MEKKNKSRKRSVLLITAGLIMIAAAMLLTGYNYADSERAGKAADAANNAMHEMITEYATKSAAEETAAFDTTAPEDRKMATMEIDGVLFIGTIEVPSINLSLPVMAECDYSRLKISPCRYYGSYYTDDLVIAGHNYSSHFSPIKRLEPGAEVVFTSADGQVFHYVVDYLDTVKPTEVEKLVTGDDWDLTLFTCTTGGQARCVVRCVKVGE